MEPKNAPLSLKMRVAKLLLFNFFTRQRHNMYLGLFENKRRLSAMNADFYYQMFMAQPIVTLFMAYKFYTWISSDSKLFAMEYFEFVPLFSLIDFLIMNKDYFNGQSIINRQSGYQVVNVNSLEPASPMRCMLRNITAPIWPLEGVLAWISPQRRLGDYIAGTMLIEVEKTDPETILGDIEKFSFDLTFLKVLLISIIITLVQLAIAASPLIILSHRVSL